eukprot:CAMPEP_0197857888 /NCGR_PEP_ID=MMETSP1438-20131217/31314_1 /TAXON_ID=1461541 /ORGANISM="Pterosperma sp., Strain CCMP1384" /LENGTH=473 /DNA_ID=CAMNT_0043473881 /DNA_START=180 /DNA_END=1601 /DNA_ORIENTATION=+
MKLPSVSKNACVLIALVCVLASCVSVTQGLQETATHDAQGMFKLPGYNHDNGEFAIIAYLPEYRHKGGLIPYKQWNYLTKFVTHLILYSIGTSPTGELLDVERALPKPADLEKLKEAAQRTRTDLMICVGGEHERSDNFRSMVQKTSSRANFIKNLVDFLVTENFHGVDYRWQYPERDEDFENLGKLVQETRAAFNASGRKNLVLTVAYYPDGHQDVRMAANNIWEHADMLHMMAFDQDEQHSTFEYAIQATSRAIATMPRKSLTLGLPAYGRDVKTAEYKTYEDLLKLVLKDYEPEMESGEMHFPTEDDETGDFYFNGIETIAKKTMVAKKLGLGGVSIWDIGGDCIMRTCRPVEGELSTTAYSLTYAINNVAYTDYGAGGALGDNERKGMWFLEEEDRVYVDPDGNVIKPEDREISEEAAGTRRAKPKPRNYETQPGGLSYMEKRHMLDVNEQMDWEEQEARDRAARGEEL